MKSCGSCTVCCSIMGVAELGKPYAAQCEHQCRDRCGIFNTRPQSCRDFECLWLADIVQGPANRPDKLGVMFAVEECDDSLVLFVYELWEEAIPENHDTPVWYWIRRIQREFPQVTEVVLVPPRAVKGTDFPIDASKYPDAGEYGHRSCFVTMREGNLKGISVYMDAERIPQLSA